MSRSHSSSFAALLLLFAMLLAAANSQEVKYNCSLPGCKCTKKSQQANLVNVDCQRTNPKIFFNNLPEYTKTLKLNDTGLNYLPNGALDNLHHLEDLHLGGNTWHCDCQIIYLWQWLKDNKNIIKGQVFCHTPQEFQGQESMFVQSLEWTFELVVPYAIIIWWTLNNSSFDSRRRGELSPAHGINSKFLAGLQGKEIKALKGNDFVNCLKKPPGCWELVLRDMGLHMISIVLLIPLFSALCSIRSKALFSCKRARAAEPPQSEESIYEEVDRSLASSAM